MFLLSGWASGAWHRRPQGADGEAGERGTGAMGVWRYGLTGQPPTARHSRWAPTPSVFIHVHRRPRHGHKRKQPRVRTAERMFNSWQTFTWAHINEDFGLFFSAEKDKPQWKAPACSDSVLQGCENKPENKSKYTSALMLKRTEREQGSSRKHPKIPP